jgi:hypothetical protein
MIRRLLLVLLLVLAPAAMAESAGSALLALRNIAAEPFLKDAVAVRVQGGNAAPMPAEWSILLADPSARGGVREITVVNGRITSERTPLQGFGSVATMPPLDPEKITVDADTIFHNVHNQAVANRVGFDLLDYTLETDPALAAPVWSVKLVRQDGTLAGTITLSAFGGGVVRPLVAAPGAEPTPSKKKVGGLVGKISDSAGNIGKRVGDTTLRVIGNVQEFLVGERTVGPEAGD